MRDTTRAVHPQDGLRRPPRLLNQRKGRRIVFGFAHLLTNVADTARQTSFDLAITGRTQLPPKVLAPDVPPQASASPDAIKADFGRRLQAALNEKGWNQSELARRVAPLLPRSSIARDNISKYVRGLPTALTSPQFRSVRCGWPS